jgi:aminopeptidase N
MVTYAKGASVLKQLVAHVGEDAFVDGLRSYFGAHAWGNATLDDLVSQLTTASGRDLAGWTRDWLDTAGTNVLELSTTVENGRYVDVRVQQRAPEAFPVLRPHTVRVGVYNRADGAAAALERRSLIEVELRGADTPVPELAGAERADLLLLNDEDLTFAELRVDAASVPDLLDRAPMLPTATSRLLAVSVARNLVVAGELPTSAFVRVSARVLAVETSDAVVEQLLTGAIRMAQLWSPEADREPLVAELADACARLADGTDSRRLFALRALASTATTDEHVELLRRASADDIDLRWRLLVRLAVLDRLDEAEVAAALEVDPDPDAWVRALTVRAALGSEAAKREVWDAFAVERRVPAGVAGDVARAFWQRAHEPVLRDYAERYLDVLQGLSGVGMIESLVAAHLLFPVVGVDEGYVDRVQAVAALDVVPPVARGVVAERVDDLRRMLRARRIPG